MSRKNPPGAPTPHDKYFRYVFQQPEPARDLVHNVLRMEPSLVGTAGAASSNVATTTGALEQLHQFRYLVFDVGLGLSDELVGGPVTRTALQVMYAASRKLGHTPATGVY